MGPAVQQVVDLHNRTSSGRFWASATIDRGCRGGVEQLFFERWSTAHEVVSSE